MKYLMSLIATVTVFVHSLVGGPVKTQIKTTVTPTTDKTQYCEFVGCGRDVGCQPGFGKFTGKCNISTDICVTSQCKEKGIYNDVVAVPTVDPDPMVNCQFTYLGAKLMRNSECKITFECEIEKGKWYLYTSRDQCSKDQTAYYANQKTNNTSSEPKTDCVLSTGTYKLTVADCQTLINFQSSLQQQTEQYKQSNQQIIDNFKNYADSYPTYAPGPTINLNIVAPTMPGITSIPVQKDCYRIGDSDQIICK